MVAIEWFDTLSMHSNIWFTSDNKIRANIISAYWLALCVCCCVCASNPCVCVCVCAVGTFLFCMAKAHINMYYNIDNTESNDINRKVSCLLLICLLWWWNCDKFVHVRLSLHYITLKRNESKMIFSQFYIGETLKWFGCWTGLLCFWAALPFH